MRQNGLFSYHFYKEHAPKNQGALGEKIKRSRKQRKMKREQIKNEKGARMKTMQGSREQGTPDRASVFLIQPILRLKMQLDVEGSPPAFVCHPDYILCFMAIAQF